MNLKHRRDRINRYDGKAACPFYASRTRERMTCHCPDTGHTVALSGLGAERIEERYIYACCELYKACPIYKYLTSYSLYEEMLREGAERENSERGN